MCFPDRDGVFEQAAVRPGEDGVEKGVGVMKALVAAAIPGLDNTAEAGGDALRGKDGRGGEI